ncbi:MAG: hypothetical protein WCH10_06610 [bacterium]
MVKQIKLDQALLYSFEHLDQASIGNPFVSQGIKFAVFIIPWVIGQAATSSIEGYYNDRLSIVLKNNIQQKLFSQENLLRLSNNKNFSVYMDNLNKDIANVANMGNSLFSGAVSTSISGAHAASVIVIHSRNLLAYTFLYQMVSGIIIQHLVSQSMGYEEELKLFNSELLDLYRDTKDHARTITERDGVNITGNRIQALSTSLIETEGRSSLWNMALRIYLKIKQLFFCKYV